MIAVHKRLSFLCHLRGSDAPVFCESKCKERLNGINVTEEERNIRIAKREFLVVSPLPKGYRAAGITAGLETFRAS